MRKYKQITIKGLIISIIIWSIFILAFWISFYELYTLCQFGRINNNITILLSCIIFILVGFVTLIIRTVKRRSITPKKDVVSYNFFSYCKVIWICAVAIIIILITGFYGTKIYHSSINYNGRLSWFIHDLTSKRNVKLEHDNIYEDGIEGILADINKKIKMPEKLYVENNFSLNFDSNGKIINFDTFLYGKNAKGETESYLITYNSENSGNITVYLNGYVDANYNDDKLLQPLIDTMKVIPLNKTVSNWSENKYGILYSGKRSFGYNSSGIIYIDPNGNTKSPVSTNSEIVGYFVSIYVPGKENTYTPVRYSITDSLNNIQVQEPAQDNKKNSSQSYSSADEFYLSKQVGYRLEVIAAAAGSKSYSLTCTNDGGITWTTINKDPFQGSVGVAAGITFLNDKLGFLCLSYSGGNRGQLYRTEDGGLSYKMVSFPEVKITLSSGETYNPFDLPGMPYEENGSLNVLVGQGADGDYNGGCKALYQSNDNGSTWKYVKEETKD